MEDKRILYVSSEVVPYLAENEVSLMSYDVPKMINDQGGQIRIFMPRYGNINERRHQLHEVIRLSGMNLVVNDLDMPLIIKVASIPKERIQVYFIDNDEYFKRKATFSDEDGVLYPDNDERAIFFAKGVVETVKKLNWVPDIIHVHGWMASLLPVYMKHYYKDEALFSDTKIVTSVYSQSFDGNLDQEMINKVKFDNIPEDAVKELETPNYDHLIMGLPNGDRVIINDKKPHGVRNTAYAINLVRNQGVEHVSLGGKHVTLADRFVPESGRFEKPWGYEELVDVNDNINTGAVSIVGNDLPQAPEHKFALNGNYTFELEEGNIVAGATYLYRSKSYANVFTREYNATKSWDQVDLRALWMPTGGKYTVIAYVKNVFNDDGYAAAVAASQRNNSATVATDRFANGARNFELTPPRIYGVELQYRF